MNDVSEFLNIKEINNIKLMVYRKSARVISNRVNKLYVSIFLCQY
jgi:hypothetical protein